MEWTILETISLCNDARNDGYCIFNIVLQDRQESRSTLWDEPPVFQCKTNLAHNLEELIYSGAKQIAQAVFNNGQVIRR